MRHGFGTERRGAVAVETAIVLPVVILLLFGFMVGGVGVFRYQQVACQAREAARWASVRGADYQKATDLASPTEQQVLDQVIRPLGAGMDPAALSAQAQWVDKGSGAAAAWDGAAKDVRSVTAAGEYVVNTVRVTVRYQWTPGILLSPMTLQGVCEMPMAQ